MKFIYGRIDIMVTSDILVKNMEIDWEALAEFWVEQYEADYGHFF